MAPLGRPGLAAPGRGVLAAILVLAMVALPGCEEFGAQVQKLGQQIARAGRSSGGEEAKTGEASSSEPSGPALEAFTEELQITTDRSLEVWPVPAPDGKALYFASDKAGYRALFALDLTNTRVQRLLTKVSGPIRIGPDGSQLFFSVGTSVAVLPLATEQLKELLSWPVATFTPDPSPDGKQLAFASASLRAAAPEGLFLGPGFHQTEALSEPSLWIGNADGSGTTFIGRGFYPRWHPSGTQLAFVSLAAGNADIWTVNVDGSELTQLTSDASDEIDPAWAPDGHRLVFSSDRRRKGNFDLWLLDLRDGRLVQLTGDPGHDGGAAWSIDGQYIYFHSQRNGDWNLYRLTPVIR